MRMLSILPLVLAGCFAIGPTATPATQPMMAPAPMTNDQALAYARAHRDTSIGVVTAVNSLGAPICRLVFLDVARREPFVNQAGPHERRRGNLDPSEQPLLAPGEKNLVSFPATGATNMVVTAFGCDRLEKHMGMYVVDENRVLFQQTVAVQDQGRVVLAR